ncbi:MAG: portal protein [Proteobacteria bacterium]|nr:MAG: portal protein [Pseudomonadota bacterium]
MHVTDFLVVACLLLALTGASVLLSRRLGLGSVLGFLAVGVAVGPYTAGFVLSRDVELLREFTELGIVLLLFGLGLEMAPGKLWSMRRALFGLGSAQMLVTGAAIALGVWLLGLREDGNTGWAGPATIGMGLALSSTALVTQLLHERGELASEHGRSAFAVLLLQDLAVIPLLALVPVLAPGGEELEDAAASGTSLLVALSVPAALYAAGRFVVPPLLSLCAHARSFEAFAMVSLLAALGAALVAATSGLSMALGAFVVGVGLSQSRVRLQVEAVLEPVRSFLMGVFFFAVGMSIDVQLVLAEAPAIAFGVTALFAAKIAILLGLGLAFGLSRAAAIRTGFLLGQGGEFGFVLFAAAGAAGVVGPTERAMVLVSIAVSMAATPLLARAGEALARRVEHRERVRGAADPLAARHRARPVIVAGYGRVGRLVCLLLEKCDVPFFAVDRDPERVAVGRRDGRDVHFVSLGDAASLAAAGVDRAAAVVVTFDDFAQTERLVAALREFHPEIPLHVRARDLATRDRLLADGATAAVPEAVEGSLHLGAEVLRTLQVTEDDVLRLLDAVRADDYAWMR